MVGIDYLAPKHWPKHPEGSRVFKYGQNKPINRTKYKMVASMEMRFTFYTATLGFLPCSWVLLTEGKGLRDKERTKREKAIQTDPMGAPEMFTCIRFLIMFKSHFH